MHTTMIATATATAAVTALIGLGASTPATAVVPDSRADRAPATSSTSTTEREHGIVLECTGRTRGLSAYVSLYENDPYGNVVQVILNDNPRRAASREPENDFFAKGKIRTGVTIRGDRAKIRGTARVVGKATAVHEVHDDAGYHIVIDGTHRRIANDLRLVYRSKRINLACDPAFAYDLQVTKTPIE